MNPEFDLEWTASLGSAGAAMAVVLGFLFLVPYVLIIRKAGWSGWWILVAFVPVVNLVMFLVFAFVEWPVQRELRAARAAQLYQQMYQQQTAQSRFSWHG